MLRMLWMLRMLRILYEHCECLVMIARPLGRQSASASAGHLARSVALSICPTVHMHSCLGLIKLPVWQLNRIAWNSSKSWRILRGICNACNVSLRYRYSYTASATAAYINVFLLDRPRRSIALRCVALRYGARLGNCSSLTGACAVEQGRGRREVGERGGVTAEAYGSLSQSSGAPHVWLNSSSNIVWGVPPRSQYANHRPPSTDADPW